SLSHHNRSLVRPLRLVPFITHNRNMTHLFTYFSIVTVILTLNIRPSVSIVGGDLVNISKYPFFAYLATFDNTIFCGGTIIQTDLILTAAHCLEIKDFQVYVGISSIDELEYAKAHKVKKAIVYPSFKNGKSWFDLGLVRLAKKVKLGPKVGTIAIATTFPKLGKVTSVVGLGNIHCVRSPTDTFHCTKSTHLRTTDLKIMQFGYRGTIKAFGLHSNICHGDSGGPMIYDNKLIGVSATVDKPTCYGGSSFAPVFINSVWIKKHMRETKT
ncbi:Trypsin, partial [Oryctes borbonicus]